MYDFLLEESYDVNTLKHNSEKNNIFFFKY